MTSKTTEYCYTISNPRRVRGIGGIDSMYPDVCAPVWNGPFCSVQEAVEDARFVWRDNHGYYPTHGEYVAVSPYTPYEPNFRSCVVLEDLQEDAFEAVGPVAQDWAETLDKIADEDRRDLHDSLKAVLLEWLKKRNLEPCFGSVDPEKATYYPLWEGAAL